MREELLKGLSEEQIAKVKACKSQEELLALAKQEGIELTDEQLEAVNGGACTYTCHDKTCPKCGGSHIVGRNIIGGAEYECRDCGNIFEWHAWDAKDGEVF